jgi:hypothetical protein
MKTLEQHFEEYFVACYPKVEKKSHQYQEMKRCWMASAFIIFQVQKHEIADLNEDDAVEALKSYERESGNYLMNEYQKARVMAGAQ